MKSIFIQIASYRDPELAPTIESLLENADNPEALKICIAHQNNKDDAWDNLSKYEEDPRFIIIDIPHDESRGACWARNQIQQYYNGEQYTLQLDSHHRFTKGWDSICIDMVKELQDDGHEKPILTTYLPSYDPETFPLNKGDVPCGMRFDSFTEQGVVVFKPYHIQDNPKKPVLARFYSAHFAFTLGSFCDEVKHDPLLYFHGEEITIAVRAYTHGYNLFHPNKMIAWHEYTRKGRVKHWDDDEQWHNKDSVAHSRTRQLLGVDGEVCSPCNKSTFLQYNIGSVRSLPDYELYSGINFKDRSISRSCNDNLPPDSSDKERFLPVQKYSLRIIGQLLKDKKYDKAAIILECERGSQLYREDIELNTITSDETFLEVTYMGNQAKQYVIYPYNSNGQWGSKTSLYL